MPDNIDLNSHYSSNVKVTKPSYMVVSPPNNLPNQHLFNDIDANIRMRNINNDIYQNTKSEKKKPLINYLKFLAGFVLVLLGVKGLSKFFKKS